MSQRSYEPADADEKTETNYWIRFGMRLGLSAALHPLEYSKTLIQLGFEPIAPIPGRTFFGAPTLIFPNIFQYAGYIKKVDGFHGCYRGLTPKLLGIVLGAIGSEKIVNYFEDNNESEPETNSEETEYAKFQKSLKRDLILHVSGIVISHPFHVITVRMMAQFIGQETIYSSIISSIKEIWSEEGIFGFFSGIIPKLLGDVTCLVLASCTTYYIQKTWFQESNDFTTFTPSFVQFVYSSILYPLNVVSTCMTVSGSRLVAGRPPLMPVYSSWQHCFNDLKIRGEHKRGSSLFWRYQPITKRVSNTLFAPLPEIAKYSMLSM